jgi:hypothetical protein
VCKAASRDMCLYKYQEDHGPPVVGVWACFCIPHPAVPEADMRMSIFSCIVRVGYKRSCPPKPGDKLTWLSVRRGSQVTPGYFYGACASVLLARPGEDDVQI